MESGQLLMFIIQTITTLVIGLVGWSLKGALADVKTSINKNSSDIKENDAKHTAAIELVKKDLNDLKSDLPLVYTLREDYIRCQQNQEKKMNSIEDKLDKLLQRS